MNSDTISLKNFLSPQAYRLAKAEKLRRLANRPPRWPEEYRNSETLRPYQPHHDAETQWVGNDTHRYLLAKGGEGGGKSVAGIIRNLERIRHGASGIMVSPDFEHFKRSLWPEFRRWCPWEAVVERQQYRKSFDWEPFKPFQMAFTTGAIVYCGGMKETDVMGWEGPNVNWAHFDECRRHKTPVALKVLDGRVRIAHNGIPPQLWFTTTPRKHWLFEFFGPLKDKDPRESFKKDSFTITLLTIDNQDNLSEDFVSKRRQSLTESEARVLLEAAWEDIEEGQRFLPSTNLWDLCKADLPAMDPKQPMVLGVDAAVGRVSGIADLFGLVGVTRHPDPKHRDSQIFVRYTNTWKAPRGGKIDFDLPRQEIRRLCQEFSVVQVAYDPTQLHDMMQALNKENLSWFSEFSQGKRRLEADRQLLDLILERRIWHNGDPDLRDHILNADRKLDSDGRRLRIVKREDALKIDLAVCLSMASHESLRLNL